MIDDAALRRGLELTLEQTDFDDLGATRYRGKVRDCYVFPAGGGREAQRAIVVTDRISAFDHILGTIPFKGQVLNGIGAFWLEVTRETCANHLVGVPDPVVTVGHECKPYAIEMIVRGYLTGSTKTAIWTHYAAGERVYCGHTLPDGLRKHERLPQPLVTPTTKGAAGEHDVPISRDEIIAQGLASAEEFDVLAERALAVFALGQELAAQRGLILVDTKYEFGRRVDPQTGKGGELVLIDEVHTPDSSRYWYADGYEEAMSAGEDPRALDKEFVRRSFAKEGYVGDGPPPPMSDELRIEAARRYIEIYEQMTGTSFVPDLTPPAERIHTALRTWRG
ncbi:MAG: phosphoribosylaminoimidazolesuccinocarboxamide synthase [Proteobacteria bacterium]|nr:MAG: phosphoribosylaminoimidazolesuccinocarboxamide synthase [Pseudomonadota bacterium]PIE18898.1 MAG: phosphoribosylaminoimidazolesuccinocarboxamide synthase [Pseudomonadota bacterium]